MVVAKTGMDQMPEKCGECCYCEKVYLGSWCEMCSMKVIPDTKDQYCPLHEINDDALDGPDWHREK